MALKQEKMYTVEVNIKHLENILENWTTLSCGLSDRFAYTADLCNSFIYLKVIGLIHFSPEFFL